MSKRAKLVLIDGKAIFHRAYHAIPHLTNKEGQPTNAVYGFAAMLLKALTDLKPDFAVVAWDKAKTSLTQRTALYSDYKIKRLKMPDDFHSQIPLVMAVTQALGLPLLELDHYEADDIIGAVIKRHPELDIVVVTNDRDMFQTLDGHVKIYMQRRGMTETEIFDAAKVQERYGIEPHQIIDLKALEGDASDNIPGVAGVGEKTAVSLLQQYGNLDGIYEHLDEIQAKLRERLETDKPTAYLSRKLATLMTDAPIELDLEQARYGVFDRQAVYNLFRQFEFKSLLDKIPAPVESKVGLFEEEPKLRQHLETAKYLPVVNQPDLIDLVAKLKQQPEVAVDVETDDIDVMTANLVGLSFSFSEGEAYYVPVGHQIGRQQTVDSRPEENELKQSTLYSPQSTDQLDLDIVIKELKPILEDPRIHKVGHNLKFDYQVLRRLGIKLAPIKFDTMIAAFLINPLGRAQTLQDLAYTELGIEMIPIEEVIGDKKTGQISFNLTKVADAARYAAEDADVSFRLYRHLAPQLKAVGLEKLASDMEWPLLPVLAEMELAGIALDTAFLKKFNKTISSQILNLEESIWQLAGERFNIGSPAQLGQVLFGKLGITVAGVRRGKTGLSTAARELEKMRGLHPVVDLLFEYRELVKLKNTYVDALPALVSSVDKRIHTSFNQTIAQTGRLSSTNPNLQNIPIRTQIGREIRRAFVAPRGRVLVGADYSQIELRIAAALSKDPAMIETFQKGVDLHQQTAAELFGVSLDKVTKEQRYAAKTINFGVLYGMSPHGLSVATGLSREDAASFIKRYYELRPKLRDYIAGIKKQAREQEYVSTLFGRRRPCPEINSNNFMIASAAERMAVNVPIQGTAADIMKLAMVALAPKLEAKTDLLLQIHDELIAETDLAKAKTVAKVMKETMENVYDLGVPIVVETSIGSNWGDLK